MSIKSTNEKGYAELVELYLEAINLRIDFILQYKEFGKQDRIEINQKECKEILDEIQQTIIDEITLWQITARLRVMLVHSGKYQDYKFYLH